VTVHDALVAWGYDRTFTDVRDREHSTPSVPALCGGAFHVDERTCTIELAEGTRLDFGGLAKGYAVDTALRHLARIGPAIVNAGGDLAVTADDEAPWPVGVDTADGSLTLALARGALATSGSDARRWRVGGREAHHLIDPRTGEPSRSDLLRATAWAPTAVEAEVRAKTLFLLGAEAAAAHASAHEIPAVLVTTDGATLRAGGLA
jgi:thiamine biosynthesis lipoprotein